MRLLTIQNVVIAVPGRGGAYGLQIAPGVRLRHRNRGDHAARGTFGEVVSLLVRRTEADQIWNNDIAVKEEVQHSVQPPACNLLDDDDRGEEVITGAAELRFQGSAEQPDFGSALPDVPWDTPVELPLRQEWNDFLVQEAPDITPKRAALRVNLRHGGIPGKRFNSDHRGPGRSSR